MGRRNANINTGAAVALLGALVFVIGLAGTIGSFLFAAAEGRGGWTVFYGAIVWGLLQFIVGLVQAIKFKKAQDLAAEEEDEDESLGRRKTAKQAAGLPTPVLVGCLGCGVMVLGGLCTFLIVMIVLQNLWTTEEQVGKDKPPPPPPPRIEPPAPPVQPVAEDLGPKERLTEILGGAFGATFKDEAPDGGFLIGLDVGLGSFARVDIVKAVQPKYATPKGVVAGRKFGSDFSKVVQVKAKVGYAVGAINVKAGSLVNGFSITFMRVKGDGLDPTDFYISEWIGDQTGGNGPTVLGGDGKLIVGIIGKRDAKDCNGLGLLKKP